MLEHDDDFKKLSEEEKTKLTRRLIKVSATNRYEARGPALQAEFEKIIAELRDRTARRNGQYRRVTPLPQFLRKSILKR